MADQPTSWIQTIGALGGLGVIATFLGGLAGHKLASAQAAKTTAETRAIEDNRGANFERAINDRADRVITALERQVEHLSNLVEQQTEQISELRTEVSQLRAELHIAKHKSPPSGKHWGNPDMMDA